MAYLSSISGLFIVCEMTLAPASLAGRPLCHQLQGKPVAAAVVGRGGFPGSGSGFSGPGWQPLLLSWHKAVAQERGGTRGRWHKRAVALEGGGTRGR